LKSIYWSEEYPEFKTTTFFDAVGLMYSLTDCSTRKDIIEYKLYTATLTDSLTTRTESSLWDPFRRLNLFK
jgi:hypothetical protein